MQESYCYHCWGLLSKGALPLILPTDTKEATPRAGEPCRCNEIDMGSLDERPTENEQDDQ